MVARRIRPEAPGVGRACRWLDCERGSKEPGLKRERQVQCTTVWPFLDLVNPSDRFDTYIRGGSFIVSSATLQNPIADAFQWLRLQLSVTRAYKTSHYLSNDTGGRKVLRITTMSFSECQEQKERVKACYGDWFQKLWGGSWDQSDCEQETYEYRQCVQDVMKRRKEQGKRKLERNVDNDWMDEVKDKSNEMANDAKSRARKARNRAREEKDEAKSKAKSTASDMSSKVQETADSWTDTIKGYARKANDKVLGSDDDD